MSTAMTCAAECCSTTSLNVLASRASTNSPAFRTTVTQPADLPRRHASTPTTVSGTAHIFCPTRVLECDRRDYACHGAPRLSAVAADENRVVRHRVTPRERPATRQRGLAITRLGQSFTEAAAFAVELHDGQERKGTRTPYAAHLFAVAGLVLESGGTEDEAIAALLHDAAEDKGGEQLLVEISGRFGEPVAEIVRGCSDTTMQPKPPWLERKTAYIKALPGKSESVIRVSLADKLHNARSLLIDYREHGEELWQRFDPESDQLWYYRSLLDVFGEISSSPLVDELDRVVSELELLVREERRRDRPSDLSVEPDGSVPAGPAGIGRAISEAFLAGQLDLRARTDAPTPGWSAMPEVEAISMLAPSPVGGSARRHFITFTMALDYSRDSLALWKASARLFNEHSVVFEPSEVILADKDQVGTLLREYGVSQRHERDRDSWLRIAHSLADRATPEVNTAIEAGTGDAAKLLAALRLDGRDGAPLFPLLRGPKIGSVWVRILAYPGGATLTSLEVVPVGVDVHVRRVTENLGLTATAGEDLERARRCIEDAWGDDVRASGAAGPPGLEDTPAALDPALWFFGKWGCAFCETQGTRVPIADVCRRCRL